MNTKRKISAIILAAFICISALAACSSNDTKNDVSDKNTNNSQASNQSNENNSSNESKTENSRDKEFEEFKDTKTYKYLNKLIEKDDITLIMECDGMTDRIIFNGTDYAKVWQNDSTYLLFKDSEIYSIPIKNGKPTGTYEKLDKNEVTSMSAEECKQSVLYNFFDEKKYIKTEKDFEIFGPISTQIVADEPVVVNSDPTAKTSEPSAAPELSETSEKAFDKNDYIKIEDDSLIQEIRYADGTVFSKIKYTIRDITDEEKEFFNISSLKETSRAESSEADPSEIPVDAPDETSTENMESTINGSR